MWPTAGSLAHFGYEMVTELSGCGHAFAQVATALGIVTQQSPSAHPRARASQSHQSGPTADRGGRPLQVPKNLALPTSI